MQIFVSHSHHDRRLADALVELLRLGTDLTRHQVFCSSSIGSGIPTGTDFVAYIRDQLLDTSLVIQLITPAFLASKFCIFEAGATWSAGLEAFPIIIPPVRYQDLTGTFGNIQAEVLGRDGQALDRLHDRVRLRLQLDTDTASWHHEREKFLRHLADLLADVSLQGASGEDTRIPVPSILRFNARELGFYPINRWSEARPLSPSSLRVTLAQDRPTQTLLDMRRLNEIANRFDPEEYAGTVCYLTDYSIDHGATDAARQFWCHFSIGEYKEHLGTIELLAEDRQSYQRLLQTFESGDLRTLARSSPTGSTKINVAILSQEQRILALQRSSAVERKRNIWTLGDC
jgi:hypothetical protein